MPLQRMIYQHSFNLNPRELDINLDYLRENIQTINVKDYGAKGDGTTDDILAIQASLDAARAGDIVMFPHGGTYIFSIPPKWPNYDNVTLYGYGATLKMASSVNQDLMTSFNYPSAGGGQRPAILGLTIDGNSGNNTGSGSMVFYGVDNGYMRDVTVQNAEGVGFFLKDCDNWTFDNCHATDCLASGFAAYDNCNNVYWVNCHALRCSPGFLLQGPEVNGQSLSTKLRIMGGSSIDSGTSQSGVQVFAGVEDFSICNMEIRGSDARGIDVHSATTAQLNATNLKPNKNGIIACNNISNNDSDEGIKIWDDGTAGKGARDILVIGNRIYDDQGTPTQAFGITLQSLADFIYVTDNDVRGNGSAGISVGGGVNANGRVWDNPGYVTMARGATSSSDGGTINHGLSITPTVVICTPTVASEMVSVTAIGGTNFTTAIKKDTGAAGTNQTIYWQASAE